MMSPRKGTAVEQQALDFFNPYRHDFARVAVAVPRVRVADPGFNAGETIAMLNQAAGQGAVVVAFPELGLSAYTCDDLFHQRALLDACEAALVRVADATAGIAAVAIVGLPLRVDHRLFNCAAVVGNGRVLGIVPKTYLPNYGEFYEARQFQAGDSAVSTSVRLGDADVPFGADLIFETPDLPLLKIACEICEDVWVPIPPSSYAALAGATVLVNLSASNITIGKSDYRHRLVSLQSSRCLAAYLYSSAGLGESTTDLGWDGQALIYESGDLLAESARFVTGSHFISADVDLERVSRERMRQNSFGYSVEKHEQRVCAFRSGAVLARPADAVSARPAAQGRPLPVRALRPGARSTSAAWRSTTSRSTRSCSASPRSAARSSSSASRAGSTRRTRCSSAPRRWTAPACREATSSPTRCPASRRAGGRSTRPSA